MTSHAGPPPSLSALSIAPAPYDSVGVQRMLKEFRASQVALYGHADDPSDTPPGEYQAPRGLFLLARDAAGQPLGCGGWHLLSAGTGEIKRMYVRPAARGRSLGRQILRLLENDARAHGLAHTQLETGALNQAALALYRAHGYVPVPPYRAGRDPEINRALRKAL
ncbi:GNAT family N-acetyltransferase [Streptomyces sp. NPDC005538]|uniref:GNAT family N-acetyltransferase n=1 Tax=Streptomyces sp. NPDC005538 TaxID=3157043 RepID=UPI0033B61EA5